uniref:Uncharacterized protein n=1 Tax=Arundo donax TaxID=35708 RepID=A0A0A9FS25_ARUDO
MSPQALDFYWNVFLVVAFTFTIFMAMYVPCVYP